MAGHGSPTERFRALSDLCEAYWHPLYAWMRARGYSADDARDGVQSFFASFLDRNAVALAEESRGKFRTFLLTSLGNHLETNRRAEAALKRGGGMTRLSWDFEGFEERLGAGGLRNGMDPERVFDRQWALAILDQAESALRAEFEQRGRGEAFEAMLPFLENNGRNEDGYAAAAESMGQTEAAFRVALHRFRKRFGQLVVEAVRETVDTEEALKQELESLYAALSHD